MSAIDVVHLTKSYPHQVAVDDLSFTVAAGRVTGFLGPNGAGKTTTLRVLLGLARASSGQALIQGQRYDRLPDPARTVGAVLEITGFHPGRRAIDHLRIVAGAAGLASRRTHEVLELVGLSGAARRRVGTFSLGMRQRLGLATALLGDPAVLVLDEPQNGLDPDGVRWLRGLLRAMAADGHAILISSHLLAEMAHTVDDVVVIDHGRLVAQGPLAVVMGAPPIQVRTGDPHRAAELLRRNGVVVTAVDSDGIRVADAPDRRLHELLTAGGLADYTLVQEQPDLERAFFALTAGASR